MNKEINNIIDTVNTIERLSYLENDILCEAIDDIIYTSFGSYEDYYYQKFIMNKIDITKLSNEDFDILIEKLGINVDGNKVYIESNYTLEKINNFLSDKDIKDILWRYNQNG